MTASRRNISHNSLCAFKALTASFATAQSQLWPDLYSCPDWNPGEKKSSAILHGIVAAPSAIPRPFYLKYICLCVHLLVVSSITRLFTKPKTQAVAFPALRHNQNVDDVEEQCLGWEICFAMESQNHSDSYSSPVSLGFSFVVFSHGHLNVSFAMVILGMWMGACTFQLPSSQVQWGAMQGSCSPGILEGITS